MMVRAIGFSTLALVSGLAGAEQTIANGGPWEIEHDMATEIVTWKDQDGEAAYQVSGTISYADLSCTSDSERTPGESFDFSEELPADTTSFQLPLPEQDGGLSVKEVSFGIEALGPNGEVLELDGFGSTGDFCFAEGLPSTGAEFEGHSSVRLLPEIALLFGVGAVSLVGGLITRRKRA